VLLNTKDRTLVACTLKNRIIGEIRREDNVHVMLYQTAARNISKVT
jgi:hypothetical protein